MVYFNKRQHSNYYYERLSIPSSGSLNRRARERRQAELNREEGERLARERRDQRARDKFDSQSRARRELATYEPWGRAGGGAPNPEGNRFTNIRAKGIFPEDELRGVELHPIGGRWTTTPRRRRRCPVRLRDDPQLFYADNLRKVVDNDIRYRQAPVQQRTYKKMLDEMVDQRYKAIQEQISKSLEDERKTNSGPWGKPGPVGQTARHPREIGNNFSKSMGWTDNATFDKMKGDHRRQKGPSLTLPQVKKDDYSYDDGLYEKNLTHTDKLPSIMNKPPSASGRKSGKENRKTVIAKKGMRSPRKNKYVKLPDGEDVTCIVPDDYYDPGPQPELTYEPENKPTQEQKILRLTGGIELVPLLARRRRVGARTLHSSDVTRPPEQPTQWRDNSTAEHLRILKNQMIAKCQRKEENRLNSAESVKRHHATWASLWGRPGHGAPQQRGRYARSNLARLLYVSPYSHQEVL